MVKAVVSALDGLLEAEPRGPLSCSRVKSFSVDLVFFRVVAKLSDNLLSRDAGMRLASQSCACGTRVFFAAANKLLLVRKEANVSGILINFTATFSYAVPWHYCNDASGFLMLNENRAVICAVAFVWCVVCG